MRPGRKIHLPEDAGRKTKSKRYTPEEESALLTGQPPYGQLEERSQQGKYRKWRRLQANPTAQSHESTQPIDLNRGHDNSLALPFGPAPLSSQWDPRIMGAEGLWRADHGHQVVVSWDDANPDQIGCGQPSSPPIDPATQFSCPACPDHGISYPDWHAPWCVQRTGLLDWATPPTPRTTDTWANPPPVTTPTQEPSQPMNLQGWSGGEGAPWAKPERRADARDR